MYRAMYRRANQAVTEATMTPEDTLREAGVTDERQATYQRRMSSLLAQRGPATGPRRAHQRG